jgi:hypothetical protein
MIEFRSFVRHLGAPLFLVPWAMAVGAAPVVVSGVSGNGTPTTPATPGNAALAQSQFLGLLKADTIKTEGFSSAAVGETYQTTGTNALFSGAASMDPSDPLDEPDLPQNPGRVASTPTSANFVGRFNTTGGFNTTVSNAWASGRWWEATGDFTIEFNSAIQAFGFYLTDAYDFKGTVELKLDRLGDGTDVTTLMLPQTVNNSPSSLIFFGFTDSVKTYKKITFDIGQDGDIATEFDVFGLDDMFIGQLAATGGAVPEPGSLALAAVSLAGLAATRRRRPR